MFFAPLALAAQGAGRTSRPRSGIRSRSREVPMGPKRSGETTRGAIVQDDGRPFCTLATALQRQWLDGGCQVDVNPGVVLRWVVARHPPRREKGMGKEFRKNLREVKSSEHEAHTAREKACQRRGPVQLLHEDHHQETGSLRATLCSPLVREASPPFPAEHSIGPVRRTGGCSSSCRDTRALGMAEMMRCAGSLR